jgi:sortase A
MKVKQRIKKWLPYLLIIIGIAPLVYWCVSDYVQKHKRIETFTAYTDNQVAEDKTDEWGLVDKFNHTHSSDVYKEIDKGASVIGWVSIESLDIKYPIYKNATDETLEKGVGHISYSDIPDGTATSCLIMGHNGTVGEPFFSHLDDLKKGDKVEVTIMDKTFTYTVSEKETVLPNEIHGIKDNGKATLTLITCTPYGVNSHRLLVHCVLTL